MKKTHEAASRTGAELPGFYNIHPGSNFIRLANALLVEIIEARESKAMEEISKL